MKPLTLVLLLTIVGASSAIAQSRLLERVKNNPNEARALCQRFRAMNSKGVSVRSIKSIKELSSERNLSQVDAEILTMYIRGLHCPDVK